MHLCRRIQKREFSVRVLKAGGEEWDNMEYQSEVLCVIQQNSLFHIPNNFHSFTFSIRIINPSLLAN